MSTKAAEEPEVKNSANTTSEEVATPKTEENLVFSMNGVCPAADDESSGASTTTTEESNISTPVAEESASEATEPTAEESSKSADQEDSGDQDAEEKPEIKVSLCGLFNFNSLLRFAVEMAETILFPRRPKRNISES